QELFVALEFFIREREVLGVKVILEPRHHVRTGCPVSRKLRLLWPEIGARKAEDHARIGDPALEKSRLFRLVFLVGGDSTAAVYLASNIGRLHVVLIGGIAFGVVIIEERFLRIITLDQPSARRIVVSDREQQRRTLVQRKLRLHQAFAKGGLAHDEGAVVI